MAKTNQTPEIRFKGFTDPWEQRKLRDIAPLRGGFAFKSEEYTDIGIPIIRISNILSDGTVGAEFAYYTEQIDDEVYSLFDGAALLAMSGATTGKVSVLHVENADKYYQNQRVGYFTRQKEYDYKFVSTIVRSPLFTDQLGAVLVAGAQPNVSAKDIDSFEFMVPLDIKEQTEIGEFFRGLDNLITLHQRKLLKTQNFKRAMLEKMFPKNGESVPEIRFAGFTDAWEQRKLSDLVDVCSGRDYKHLSEGTIPVYGTGGYMLSVSEALSYDRDAIGIGRKGTIDKPYILKAPFWTVDTLFYAVPEHSECLDFVHDVFQIIDWKKKDESTGVPSLSKEAINDTDVMAPKLDEQLAIGEFFARIDTLITLHQRKLEKLQNIKKSMLAKMFA